MSIFINYFPRYPHFIYLLIYLKIIIYKKLYARNCEKNLKVQNAKKVHKMMLYRRYVFHLLNDAVGYIRTREENKLVTITMKTYSNTSKHAQESEIVVNSTLEESRDFLLAQGYKLKAYHETLREKWSLGKCLEIAIDSIPGIPTYVELECKSEKEIIKVAELLNLDFSKI